MFSLDYHRLTIQTKLRREAGSIFRASRYLLYTELKFHPFKRIYIFYHSSAFSNLCLNNSSYSSFILNKPKQSFFYIIYILGKVYIIIRRKHGKSRSSCRVRVRIPTDRLKRDTRCSFLSIPRHFPVSVFHDCQMRSPVFSCSCLSPLLSLSSLPAYRDESARHESNDRRGFRFQRGGAE